MAEQLTRYLIFLGSPGGLEKERKCFQTKLKKYTDLHAALRGVLFHPVGWEDTSGGVGRPQERINEDLRRCDYAVFVLHDRWGTPSGDGHKSRTEAEIALAEELYEAKKIRNILLIFKKVNLRQMRDPGEQLKAVLAFRRRIEKGERYLFKEYNNINQFADILEEHLARWLKDREGAESTFSESGPGTFEPSSTTGSTPVVEPPFDYWITEAMTLLQAQVPDNDGALFCARKAIHTATSDIEWARGKNLAGIALLHLGKDAEAIAAFSAITDRFTSTNDRG